LGQRLIAIGRDFLPKASPLHGLLQISSDHVLIHINQDFRKMPTTADFLQACQWAGIATLFFALVAGVGFFLQWGIRFRLVGIAGFMLVLTGGLFGLSIVPFSRAIVPGAVHYTLVFDDAATRAVIAVSNTITPTELDATLRQAGGATLKIYGRLSREGELPTLRARTILHPEPGVSQLVYLGQIQRMNSMDESSFKVDIFRQQFAALPTQKPA
jgi:hypothetical protein